MRIEPRAMPLVCAALATFAGPVLGQTAADSTAIRAVVLDYAEGWYTGDGDRMQRALHPDLAKRIVLASGGPRRSST